MHTSRGFRVGNLNHTVCQGTKWVMLLLPSRGNKTATVEPSVMPRTDRFKGRKEWSFASHAFVLIKVGTIPLKILESSHLAIPHRKEGLLGQA